ncbi:MAG: LURP-one-related family protein [Oscillospiraceae bacterium]|nr:LURP-one-related family protein [Oscillospiraceae bacterium]
MRLMFKQRFFSWFDSYDIFDASGRPMYTVKGELAWGHQLRIYDTGGWEVGMVKQKIFSLLPTFEMYMGGSYVGRICKEFSFFTPKYNIEYNGYYVEGDLLEWDYEVYGPNGRFVANVGKELFNWTDTYVIDVADPKDTLCVLMLVLAIDAEKCSRD